MHVEHTGANQLACDQAPLPLPPSEKKGKKEPDRRLLTNKQ